MQIRPLFAVVVVSSVLWACAQRVERSTWADGRLPWEQESRLKDAAAAAGETAPLASVPGDEPAARLGNDRIASTIWGTPGRVTISILRNDVWDRRVKPVRVPTLAEILAGAESPANRVTALAPSDRAVPPLHRDGYLAREGGWLDPLHAAGDYPFPVQKPVGQIILGFDGVEAAAVPSVRRSLADGSVSLAVAAGGVQADATWALSRRRDVYALRLSWQGGGTPPWLRLYRHRDTAHLTYMTPDGTGFLTDDPAYPRGAGWNGPLDPPVSGRDGRFFWVLQHVPAERTFPKGFDYVMMGVVSGAAEQQVFTVDGQPGLGTPVPDAAVRAASGSAATAVITPDDRHQVHAFVTVVTSLDAPDVLVEARKRLIQAQLDGFAAIQNENRAWYADFYDRRESGRVFYGDGGAVSDDLVAIHHGWSDRQGGGTRPDATRGQASADGLRWDIDHHNAGAPLFSQVFATPSFVANQGDREAQWVPLVRHWLPAAQRLAREQFALPGAALLDGELPPVTATSWVCGSISGMLALETAAQAVKPVWDAWDYSGDKAVLRGDAYPALRELARFYAAYAKPDAAGVYHLTPALPAGNGMIRPGLAQGRDPISALGAVRWTLTRAADAADLLGLDGAERTRWREIVAHLAPYPVVDGPAGQVYATVPDAAPVRRLDDHPWLLASYPSILADDITLDSPAEVRERMLRTVRASPSTATGLTEVLLGAVPEVEARDDGQPAAALATYPALRSAIARHPERLLNSRSGRIHVFPCVPAWADLAFRRFQARGGFLVSAVKDATGVTLVEIEARRTTACTILNPWPGRFVVVRESGQTEPVAVTPASDERGESLTFAAVAGCTYRLERR